MHVGRASSSKPGNQWIWSKCLRLHLRCGNWFASSMFHYVQRSQRAAGRRGQGVPVSGTAPPDRSRSTVRSFSPNRSLASSRAPFCPTRLFLQFRVKLCSSGASLGPTTEGQGAMTGGRVHLEWIQFLWGCQSSHSRHPYGPSSPLLYPSPPASSWDAQVTSKMPGGKVPKAPSTTLSAAPCPSLRPIEARVAQ